MDLRKCCSNWVVPFRDAFKIVFGYLQTFTALPLRLRAKQLVYFKKSDLNMGTCEQTKFLFGLFIYVLVITYIGKKKYIDNFRFFFINFRYYLPNKLNHTYLFFLDPFDSLHIQTDNREPSPSPEKEKNKESVSKKHDIILKVGYQCNFQNCDR